MKIVPGSKVDRARQKMEQAQALTAEALSLMGGRVVKYRDDYPLPHKYVSRLYCQEAYSRLEIAKNALLLGEAANEKDLSL